MADIKHYFEEEMRHLLKSGREFAQEYPDSARRLSLDDGEDCDPYVERLLEGFAFLTARIRQSLDVEEDGLAGHLLELVAPGIEIPLPAVSLVEFEPRRKEFVQTLHLKRGMQILSAPQAELLYPCRFSLVRDLDVTPVSLLAAGVSQDAGSSALDLEFEYWGQSFEYWPDPLPFFLQGDQAISWAVRYWLLHKVAHVDVVVSESDSAAGADVVLRSPSVFPGYSFVSEGSCALLAMRDFLNAEDRFRFIELRGLSRCMAGPGARLRLRLRFFENFPRTLEREIGVSLFRMHAVPVVNCFQEDCEPVQMDLTRVDYPLEAARGRSIEILDVREVIGIDQADPTRRHGYRRFSSYSHLGRKGDAAAYFEVLQKGRRGGGVCTSLAVGNVDPGTVFAEEYLSVRALCCDGDVPRERLQPADLCELDPSMPATMAVHGLTRPSAVVRPPDVENRRWRLLSHFQRSFRGLCDIDLLKRTLGLLVWDGRESRRRLVEGVSRVSCRPNYRVENGITLPEMLVSVGLKDELCTAISWERLGQLDAFGELLWQLFSEEAPLGNAVHLRLELEPSEVVLEYPPHD